MIVLHNKRKLIRTYIYQNFQKRIENRAQNLIINISSVFQNIHKNTKFFIKKNY